MEFGIVLRFRGGWLVYYNCERRCVFRKQTCISMFDCLLHEQENLWMWHYLHTSWKEGVQQLDVHKNGIMIITYPPGLTFVFEKAAKALRLHSPINRTSDLFRKEWTKFLPCHDGRPVLIKSKAAKSELISSVSNKFQAFCWKYSLFRNQRQMCLLTFFNFRSSRDLFSRSFRFCGFSYKKESGGGCKNSAPTLSYLSARHLPDCLRPLKSLTVQ